MRYERHTDFHHAVLSVMCSLICLQVVGEYSPKIRLLAVAGSKKPAVARGSAVCMLLTNLRLSKEANSLDLDEGVGYIHLLCVEPAYQRVGYEYARETLREGISAAWMRKSLAALPKCARAQLGWEPR